MLMSLLMSHDVKSKGEIWLSMYEFLFLVQGQQLV